MESVHKTIDELKTLFTTQMGTFQSSLQSSAALTPSNTTLEVLSKEFSVFRGFILAAIENLQKQVDILAKESDDIEMRSRRNTLLIHGVPEDNNEVPVELSLNVFTKNASVSSLCVEDITQCHRLGQKKLGKTRPLLVKFRDVSVRNKVWYSKTSLKGSGITLSEFLTLRRHTIFMAARRRFGVNKCWSRDGSLYVAGPEGVKHLVSSLLDVDSIPVGSSTETVATTSTSSKPSNKQIVGVSTRNMKAKK